MNKDMRQIKNALFQWYENNRRVLPWRENRTAYRVWISEIMLQQTQVNTVIDYFNRWMELWPTVETLAAASENEVLKAWEGLGYYSRARNILKTAKFLDAHEDIDFSQGFSVIRQLPGIGDYTAAAISSFVNEEQVAAVDANVLRVISRLFLFPWTSGEPKSHRTCKLFLEEAMSMLSQEENFHPGKWNEALIELGALVCQARRAHCDACPLQAYCQAYNTDTIYEYPKPKTKTKRKEEFYTVLILYDVESKTFAVEKRESQGLLANLWQFPLLDGHRSKEELYNLLEDEFAILSIQAFDQIKHIFSHLIWQLTPYIVVTRNKGEGLELKESMYPWKWLNPDQVMDLPFSSSLTELRNRVLRDGIYLEW